ncbi:MAG: hypothetical protein ACMXX5_00115 [Candidatus Woesearchaeota archaeon]
MHSKKISKKDEVKAYLSNFTKKNNIYLNRRGNIAVRDSIRTAMSRGYKKILIQDQGGWLTYPQFAEKFNLDTSYFKTDYGIVKGSFKDSIILINTMPGYSFYQPSEDIKTKNCIIINDVSGSIGTDLCSWGDIVFGSFGKDKPVDLGESGFIATDFNMDIEDIDMDEKKAEELLLKLYNLDKRRDFLLKINSRIKKDLKKYDIIHRDKQGFNVLVKTRSQNESDKIIEYCERNNYEFTICPRYIRMNAKGISIEVKRLQQS